MNPQTVHPASHRHWRREWWQPFEQSRLSLLRFVDRLLDLIEHQAGPVHLDPQAIVLEDYLELRPSREAILRRLIEEGRILIGPWYVLPDERLVSGEALVRNLAHGHRVSRRLGAGAFVARLPDGSRHVSQLAQIFRGFGVDTATGGAVGGPESVLEAPDGSNVRILATGSSQGAGGVLSTRTYLKQANARAQLLLERWAEPLALFSSSLPAPYPADELRYAWRSLLQNQADASIRGCGVDAVHDENLTRYLRARQVAEGVRDGAIDAIVRALPAGDPGTVRCAALNPGAQPYSGTLEAAIDLPLDAGIATVTAVRGPDGRLVPVQLLEETFITSVSQNAEGLPATVRARRLRLLWPGEVPAFGYATFDLLLDDETTIAPAPKPRLVGTADRSAENEFLRLSINDDGTVDVVDRRTATRFARCGAIEDVGDVGDEYDFCPPASNVAVTPEDARDVHITRVHAGPLRAAFRIDFTLPLPISASGDRHSRSAERVENQVSVLVSLDTASPRVHWDVTVDNRARDHRLRMLFPIGADEVSDVRVDTAFGVSRQRAAGGEGVPMLSFAESGSAAIGVILHGIGVTECAVYPADDITGARIALTLLRCVGDLSRDDLATRPAGHAGPALATPGAQCAGPHTFRLAFEPRGNEPAPAALFARSAAFLVPPGVVAAEGAGGALPLAGSFLTVEATRGEVVVSACKRAEDRDGTIVRLFNPDEAPATVRLRARNPVQHAWLVNLLEERTQDLPVRAGGVEIALRRHSIRTVELEY